MAVSQEQFDLAQEKLVINSDIIHQFTTNDEATVVDAGEGKTFPSLAKIIKDTQDQVALTLGEPLGICDLDQNGLVPPERLPSYVDDVIEVATFSALPGVGESGKIYIVVADETLQGRLAQYRWTGSAYAEIVASPGSTSAVAEGSNLYFTEQRVRDTKLTGLAPATGAVAATDGLLAAINKLVGNQEAFAKVYDMLAFTAGKPAAAATLLFSLAGRSFTLPAGLAGSRFKSKVAATAAATVTLYKNGVSFATINWAAGATVPTVVAAAATSFVPGDELTAVAPATQDATLADIALTVVGSLN